MKRPSRIALVGFMGAGKTTVGRRLAERIGHRFVDTDDEIVARARAPVPEIFRRDGEEAFRTLERQVIDSVLMEENIVIATGGGGFAQPRGADQLLRGAFVVHLHCDFDEAFRRAALLSGRPLIDQGKTAAQALFAERKDKYSRAHATVSTSSRTPDEVVEDILLLLASPSLIHRCAT